MRTPKWPLVAALSLATVFLVACGDEKDPRISDADALCLKIMRNGGTCAGQSVGGTSTATVTNTQTQTNTQTVTITNTGTSN